MKKLICLAMLSMFLALPAYAFEPPDWTDVSAVKTADSLIYTGAGFFYGIMCQTDGTNSVTFAIYDSTTASGSTLMPSVICTTSSSNRMCSFGSTPPVAFKTGLYIDITSSDGSPDYSVYFRGK